MLTINMTTIIIGAFFILLVINIIILIISFRRPAGISDLRSDRIIRDELRAGRDDAMKAARNLREEVSGGLQSLADTIVKTMGQMGNLQKTQLDGITRQLKDLTESNQSRIEQLRNTIDIQLKHLQEGNEKKLDEMRRTVDEKLQGTLEKRLGESFKIVSERLEAVQRGLGEMQTLATGVGDLKRVLTNVKARGTWGEIQLGALLEQILTPDQYDKNVKTKEDSQETVEYAIRLPGPKNRQDSCVWLPIDSKFPQEDYLRLVEAAETADADGVQTATSRLVRAVKTSAQEIGVKYLSPPNTTDFAIMFLPTEGLYAEILRQPGLVEDLQQSFRIIIAGPTSLSAILNSLRMGFRTLAIEKRSSEVWKVLAAVKTEFGKLGDVFSKLRIQLTSATKTIDATGVRTRAMERKLREVEELPPDKAAHLLGLSDVAIPDTAEEDGQKKTEKPHSNLSKDKKRKRKA
jgi:DNA recombination protein RmuC